MLGRKYVVIFRSNGIKCLFGFYIVRDLYWVISLVFIFSKVMVKRLIKYI